MNDQWRAPLTLTAPVAFAASPPSSRATRELHLIERHLTKKLMPLLDRNRPAGDLAVSRASAPGPSRVAPSAIRRDTACAVACW